MPRRNAGDVPQPVARTDRREEDTEELTEGDANRGDGSGLDYEEECPAIKKAP